jgi:hypothetical protein
MRARLRAIIETEHGRNHPVKLVRQMDDPGPPAVETAGIFELLQVDAKSNVELCHGAGEHDRATALVVFNYSEPVLVRELPDRLEIGRVRPELSRVLIVGQVTLGSVAGSDFPDHLLQFVVLAVSKEHGDFQPFRGVRLSHRPGAG